MNKELKKTYSYWNKNPTRYKFESFKKEATIIYKKEHWMEEEIERAKIKNLKVLDAGCGQGLNLWKMLQCKADVRGIDFSDNAIKECKRRLSLEGYDPSIVNVADIQNLKEIKNNTFDVVFSLGVLHHIPDFSAGLKELHRVCKPGGRIIIMVYSKNNIQNFGLRLFRFFGKSLFKFIKPNKNKKYGTFWHELLLCPIWNTYSRKQLRKLFENVGFINVRFKRTFTGLTRVNDFIPLPKFINNIFYKLDNLTKRKLGFYEMVYARKARIKI
ncbi:MAG: methyltransferase domain-containing protein [Candidatus Woesearchaeota archaeon]